MRNYENYKNKSHKSVKIILNNLILFLVFFLIVFSYKIFSKDTTVGVVYSKRLLHLFPEIEQKVNQINQQIYYKERELYNLPRTLEIQFLSQLENYSKELLKNQKKLENEIKSKVLTLQNLDNSIKTQIEDIKRKTEKQIEINKLQTQKKLYQIEKEIYHLINTELHNLKNKYQIKVDFEIQQEIYKSKEEIQKYREKISEIYKNEIINLNLKLSNSTIYDSVREEILRKLQQIKQKQEELINKKIKLIESQIYEKINLIQKNYQKEYEKESHNTIKKYEEIYKKKHNQIISEYQKTIEQIEKEYNSVITSILKQSQNNALKELYEEYNLKLNKLQDYFEKFRKKLAQKYDKLLFQKFYQLTTEIEALQQQKENLENEFKNNIFNIIKQKAIEKKLKYVFFDPLYHYNCIDITQECIEEIKKIRKNK